MLKNYSNGDLRKTTLKNRDLRHACFYASDLRGIDFSGSDLTGANFINVRTGIKPLNIFLIFFGALAVSAISVYVAMEAGNIIQVMLASGDQKVRITGMV